MRVRVATLIPMLAVLTAASFIAAAPNVHPAHDEWEDALALGDRIRSCEPCGVKLMGEAVCQTKSDVTVLLQRWSDGEQLALENLMPLIYAELRKLARRYLRRERQGHTLETSALVNEAYLKLIDQDRVRWQNRAHFFAIAAQIMRRILVDHARKRRRQRRGGGAAMVSLDEALLVAADQELDLVAVDDALSRLTEADPQKARLVEMRFFGGLTHTEIAAVLGVSLSTVERQWRVTRAWLCEVLSD